MSHGDDDIDEIAIIGRSLVGDMPRSVPSLADVLEVTSGVRRSVSNTMVTDLSTNATMLRQGINTTSFDEISLSMAHDEHHRSSRPYSILADDAAREHRSSHGEGPGATTPAPLANELHSASSHWTSNRVSRRSSITSVV